MNEQTQPEAPASPAQEQKNPYLVPGAIVLAGLFIAIAVFFQGGGAGGSSGGLARGDALANPTGRELEEQVLPVTDQDHIYGPKDADVFLIEYSDYQCPFCTRFHETIMEVLETYEGKVAWVYRHFPLESIHPEARPAANAAECIAEQGGDEAFYAFTNAVFEENLTLSADTYKAQAEKLGVDVSAFEECMASGRYNDLIDAHMENSMAIGGNGTPFNVLLTRNGDTIKFSGAQPIERVDAFVQRALNSLK